jgi:hypothetical protein
MTGIFGGGGSGGGGGGSGAIVKLASVICAGNQTEIDFSSFGGYEDLLITMFGQTSESGYFSNVGAQFNGDTTNDYTSQYLSATGISIGLDNAVATSAYLGLLAGTSAFSVSAYFEAVIPQYTNTAFPKLSSTNSFAGAGPNPPGVHQCGSQWENTAAISTIKIFVVSGAYFINGTVCNLYGRS